MKCCVILFISSSLGYKFFIRSIYLGIDYIQNGLNYCDGCLPGFCLGYDLSHLTPKDLSSDTSTFIGGGGGGKYPTLFDRSIYMGYETIIDYLAWFNSSNDLITYPLLVSAPRRDTPLPI